VQVSDFDFQLPSELIAQHPLPRREDSRLLVIDKDGEQIKDAMFTDFPNYLKPGDVLVLNDTRVLPARLIGVRPGGGQGEVLLLHERGPDQWEALVRPGRKMPLGGEITFGDGLLRGKIIGLTPSGERIIQFSYQGSFPQILAELGEVPLPPYIREKLHDPERYQTIYSREEGSAAAPTAGLHFNPQVLDKIKSRGVVIGTITLHVGIGTFRPVKTEKVEEHQMHSEYYRVTPHVARIINEAKEAGGKLFAVGTTVARTLESVAREDGVIEAKSGWTDIFIYPGYQWKVVDNLLTNFHLPQSTLLMLVSSLAGRELTLKAYQHAITKGYRFFSFGDASLIVGGDRWL
jgi:S-adenosylmethionine:tRNA ribosyltransferase-isomerase